MLTVIIDFLREFSAGMVIGQVLEVGSRNVNGSPRTVFQDRANSYTGVDIDEGDGVDVILDGEQLLSRFTAQQFDTVVCCETLEHTIRPWIIVEQMKTVLKSGGYLWVSTPTYGFPEHKYPIDCYRFAEDAYRLWLFADMELIALRVIHDCPVIVAVGRKY